MKTSRTKENLFKDLFLILIIGVVASLIIMAIREGNFYSPITITFEIKSDTLDTSLLQYDTGAGFNKRNTIQKYHSDSNSFTRLFFSIEANKVQNIKIKPAIRSKKFQIGEITLRTGKYTLNWKPGDILRDFKPEGLIRVDSGSVAVLSLSSVKNQGGSLTLKQWLPAVVNQKDTRLQKVLILLTLLLSVGLSAIIWFKPGWFYKQVNRLYLNLVSFFNIGLLRNEKRLLGVVAISILIKLMLVSHQPLVVLGNSPHDDAHYIWQASDLLSGTWLGPYDGYTLIKGIGYPVFIAISAFFGISILTLQHALYGVACLLLVYACSGIFRNSWMKSLAFIVLFFNPMTVSHISLHPSREALHSLLEVMIFAGYIGMYVTMNGTKRQILRWALLTSIALAFYWHVREEGILLLPLIFLLTVLSFVSLFKTARAKAGLHKATILNRQITNRIFLILLPLLMLVSGNLLVAAVNKIKYGSFVTNELKSSSYTSALSALAQIKHEHWDANIPVPRDAREKAYKVSPAMASLKPFLESPGNGWKKFGPGDSSEIKGGWFVWALRDAAMLAGYHNTLKQSQEFYDRIAREINYGLKSGKLPKSNTNNLLAYSWEPRYAKPMFSILPEVVKELVTFASFKPYSVPSSGTIHDLVIFQKMTNSNILMPNCNYDTITPSFEFRNKILFWIARIYQLLNPLFLVFSLIGAVILVFISEKNYHGLPRHFILFLLAGILYFIMARIIVISYISVAQWPAISIRYLYQAYPFILIYNTLVISILLTNIKRYVTKLKKHANQAS
jgi:hypothetical protein